MREETNILIEKLEDLLVQATTEHSHNYTANLLKASIEMHKLQRDRIEALAMLLKEANK
jgi:hypothetical protein